MSALTPAEKKVIDEAVYAAESREPDEALFAAVETIIEVRENAAAALAVNTLLKVWNEGASEFLSMDAGSAHKVGRWLRHIASAYNACPICAGTTSSDAHISDMCEPHRNDFIGWADEKNRERAERAQARFDATPFEKPVSGNTGNADAKTEENR